jgi:hypothetical protein
MKSEASLFQMILRVVLPSPLFRRRIYPLGINSAASVELQRAAF